MKMYLKFKDADKKRANKSRSNPQQKRQAKARAKHLIKKLRTTK